MRVRRPLLISTFSGVRSQRANSKIEWIPSQPFMARRVQDCRAICRKACLRFLERRLETQTPPRTTMGEDGPASPSHPRSRSETPGASRPSAACISAIPWRACPTSGEEKSSLAKDFTPTETPVSATRNSLKSGLPEPSFRVGQNQQFCTVTTGASIRIVPAGKWWTCW